MNTENAGWTRRERLLLVIAAAALALSVIALLTRGTPVNAAGGKIGSKDVANNSLKSIDIRNHSLGSIDMNIYIANSNTVTVPGNGFTGVATANCNPGDNVLGGGGGIVNAAPPQSQLTGGSPGVNSNTEFWSVSAENNSPTNMQIAAQAVCMVN